MKMNAWLRFGLIVLCLAMAMSMFACGNGGKDETTEKKPTQTTEKKPEATTEKPEVTSEKPEVTTEKPEVTTEKPEVTTEKPEVTTEKPEVTTEKPEVTTEKPEVTTEKPEETTEDPNAPCEHVEGDELAVYEPLADGSGLEYYATCALCGEKMTRDLSVWRVNWDNPIAEN